MEPRKLSLSNVVISYEVRPLGADEAMLIGQHLHAYGMRGQPNMPGGVAGEVLACASRALMAVACVVLVINGAATGALVIERDDADRTKWVIAYDTTPTYAGAIMHPEVLRYAIDWAHGAGCELVERRLETTVWYEAVVA